MVLAYVFCFFSLNDILWSHVMTTLVLEGQMYCVIFIDILCLFQWHICRYWCFCWCFHTSCTHHAVLCLAFECLRKSCRNTDFLLLPSPGLDIKKSTDSSMSSFGISPYGPRKASKPAIPLGSSGSSTSCGGSFWSSRTTQPWPPWPDKQRRR